MDIEKLNETFTEGLAEVKTKFQETADATKKEVKAEINTLEEKYNELIKDKEKSTEEQKSALADMQEHLDKLDIRMQKKGAQTQTKSFNEVLVESIDENAEELKSFAQGSEKSLKLSLKAAGDMSYDSNFGGTQGNLTTEFRQSPLPLADSTVYLRDLLSKGTTNAASIWYPKHTGGEGGAATWATGSKPVMDFDFEAVNAPVQWIAGIVRVPRQMLDDIAFLRSFLQANMLKSLYKAENDQILNGDGVSPNLLGLRPQAQEYNGSYTSLIEKIIDAGYGQIVENGHSPNAVALNARDAIGIYLNKASGSGEYDNPNVVGFVNGKLTIGGMTVVQAPSDQVAPGEFLVGDFNAAQLITRLNPEIRFFEQDVDNVQKNMITVRIEERVALPVYYPNAFVKEASASV